MNSSSIQKYSKKSIPQLIKLAEKRFNKFIRERDKDKPCISCGKFTTLEAGHFFSAGHHPILRFNEFNVNGQCKHCNCFLHGNLLNYRQGFINKYGIEKLTELEFYRDYEKRHGFKWDRFLLIDIIEKYK